MAEELLKGAVADRFVVVYDDKNFIWKVVNMWHKDLQGKPSDFELEDTHPAVTILQEQAVIEIIKKADQVGILKNVFKSEDDSDYITSLEEEIKALKEKVIEYKEASNKTPASENFHLKRMAFDSIMKIVAMDGTEKLAQ